MRRILAILNARAGTLLDGGIADPAALLARAFEERGDKIDVVLASPLKIGSLLERAARSDHDTILIGGGDGSVNRAIGRLHGTGKTLGVLPLGTLNLLGRDLGIPKPFEQAVAALAAAEPHEIDLGFLNDRPFHSVCGLGYFAQVARAREQLRDLPLPVIGRYIAWMLSHLRAYRRSMPFAIEIEVDGVPQSFETFAILATVNRFDGTDWRRSQLDEGCLELHVASTATPMRRAALGKDLITGAWRDNPDIDTVRARSLVIHSRRPRRWTSTDGELRLARTPLRIEVRPRALNVLVAKPTDGA